MKRTALLIITMLTLGFAAQVQSIFTKGTTTANIGLDIGSTLLDEDFSVLLPPLPVGIDHSAASGLFDGNGSIDVGGYLGVEACRYKGFGSSVWSQTLVGPRGFLHYQLVDKLGTYFNLMLGVNIISWSCNMKAADNTIKDKDTAAGFGWSVHIGAHYYLSDRWVVMGELGYRLTFLILGTIYCP